MLTWRNAFLGVAISLLLLSLGEYWQGVWKFIFGVPSPLWEWVMTKGSWFDVFLRDRRASPSLMMVGICTLLITLQWGPILDFFLGRITNRIKFADEFNSPDQTEARAIIKRMSETAFVRKYRSISFVGTLKNSGIPEIPANLRILDATKSLSLTEQQSKLLAMARSLYPDARKGTNLEFDRARARSTKFWDKYGRLMISHWPAKLKFEDIKDQSDAAGNHLTLLVYLELAQILQDEWDTGWGKRGLFYIAKKVVEGVPKNTCD